MIQKPSKNLILDFEQDQNQNSLFLIKRVKTNEIQVFPSEIWSKIFEFTTFIDISPKLICKQILNLNWKHIWSHNQFKIYISQLPWTKFDLSHVSKLKVITDEEEEKGTFNIIQSKKLKLLNSKENLEKLKIVDDLDLSNSLIDEFGINILFSRGTKIKKLNLSKCQKAYNALDSIKGVEELDLSHLFILNFPSHLLRIKSLNLSNTEVELTYIGVEKLNLINTKSFCLKNLDQIENLKELSCQNNVLKENFMKKITNLESLRLDIVSSLFYSEGIRRFQKLKVLKLLNITNERIKDLGLSHLHNLEYLQLENINIFDKDLENLSKIHTLKIGNANSFTGKCFKSLTNLKNLKILYNLNLDEEFFFYLKNLKKLHLVSSNIEDDNIFKELKSLKVLKLSSCNFTDKIFQFLPELKHLSLNNCKITGDTFDKLELSSITLKDHTLELNEILIKNIRKNLIGKISKIIFETSNFDPSLLTLFKNFECIILKNCKQIKYQHLLKLKGPQIFIKPNHNFSQFDVSTLKEHKIKVKVENPHTIINPIIQSFE